jgi:hypothetical protein
MDAIVKSRLNSQVASCHGKVAFKKQRFAKDAAHRRKGRVAYRCKYCFLWHVGTPEPKAKKFTKRKKLIQLFLQPEWRQE